MTKILVRKPLAVAIRNSLIAAVAAIGLTTAGVALAQNNSGGNQNQGQQAGNQQGGSQQGGGSNQQGNSQHQEDRCQGTVCSFSPVFDDLA